MTKIAVVTGSSKGIGLALVRVLCKRFEGIVYLTSRDEKRGAAAVAALNQEGLHPHYHQLDITDKDSITTFRDYLKEKYGFIDILANNAAIAFKNKALEPVAVQAEQTLFVNYFSVLSTCEILFPIVRNGGQVVNISCSAGHLSLIPSETLRKRFQDPNLTIPELSKLMNQYVEAAKEGTHAAEWGNSSYVVSKVGLIALTKIQQRFLNDRDIKAVGYVVNDIMSSHNSMLFIDEGAHSPKPSTSGAQAQTAKTTKPSADGSVKTSTNKRHRPDDAMTTPSGANKKARTDATPKTYAAAAKSDLIAAVTVTNTRHLTKEQAEEVQETLNSKLWTLVQARTSNPPKFQGNPTYVHGSLQLWCMNAEAMEWLKFNIDGHTLTSGVKVEVRRQVDLPRKVRCGILIPGKAEAYQIGEALRYFNPWAGVERWLLHTAQKQTAGTFLVVSIPEDLIPQILEHGRQLCFLLGAVYVKFEEHKGKFSDKPPKVEKVRNKEEVKQPASTPPTSIPDDTLPSTSGELDIGTGDDSEDGVPFTN